MATHLTQNPLIPQDENLDVLKKGSVVKGKPTGSKLDTKKPGARFGSRKALGDITNKSSLHHEASLKRKNIPKEEPDVSEEMFLHDHKKCIESQAEAMRQSLWETVMPGCVPLTTLETREMKSTKSDLDLDSECLYQEPEEIPMSEFYDIFRRSPSPFPPSPICLDSPPSSPFELEFVPLEFKLKEDNDP